MQKHHIRSIHLVPPLQPGDEPRRYRCDSTCAVQARLDSSSLDLRMSLSCLLCIVCLVSHVPFAYLINSRFSHALVRQGQQARRHAHTDTNTRKQRVHARAHTQTMAPCTEPVPWHTVEQTLVSCAWSCSRWHPSSCFPPPPPRPHGGSIPREVCRV